MTDHSQITGKKILITGGAGFIGTAVTTILAKDNEVIIFDNFHNNAVKNTNLKTNPNIRFEKGCILDNNALERVMDADIEYLIHCAGIAGVDTVLQNPVLTLKVNIQGIFNVFKAAEQLPKLRRIINFSSSEIYGKHTDKDDEYRVNPEISVRESRWTYAISKLTGEIIAHSYKLQENLPVVTIRPFNVFGPNQIGIGAVNNFVARSLNNDPLIVHNNGAQIRSWCYIEDFVTAVLLTLEKEIAIGQVYNIGNPDNTISVYDLATKICSLSKSSSRIDFEKINYPEIEVRIPRITRARQHLGFQPKISIDEGLRRTISWYKNNGRKAL